jgi:hypothetical protein
MAEWMGLNKQAVNDIRCALVAHGQALKNLQGMAKYQHTFYGNMQALNNHIMRMEMQRINAWDRISEACDAISMIEVMKAITAADVY